MCIIPSAEGMSSRIRQKPKFFKRFLIGEILNDPLSDFDSDAAGINIEDREFHRVSINESRGWQLFDIGLGEEHNFSPASVIVACEDVLYSYYRHSSTPTVSNSVKNFKVF